MQELATPRSLLHGLHGPPCRILTPLRRSAVSVQTLTYFWLESERPLLKAAFRPAGGRWIHSFGGLPGSNLTGVDGQCRTSINDQPCTIDITSRRDTHERNIADDLLRHSCPLQWAYCLYDRIELRYSLEAGVHHRDGDPGRTDGIHPYVLGG